MAPSDAAALDAWHAARARVVGASEVAALFGCSPHTSHWSLWQIKAGRVAAPDLSGDQRVTWGLRLESVIADAVAEERGWTILPGGHRTSSRVEGWGCTLDREIGDRGGGVLELKTVDWLVRKRDWGEEPPPHILLQLQAQLGVTGREWGAVAALVGGNELRIWEYQARPRIIAEIAKRVRAFWKSIRENRPPPVDGSPSTADTLAALKHARALGMAHTLTICNVATSAMVRECELAYITRAGVEIGVASTKAFTTQLAGLFLLTLALAQSRGRLSETQEAEHLQTMRHLPVALQAVLALEPQVMGWAEDFARMENALFLGRGLHFPIALEGALKLKEISYIHAEAYPAGELKHGPLALVTSSMPVVTVAPNDALLEKLKSNMQEVRARGGVLYVLADADTHIESSEGIHVIRMPEHYGALSPILHVLPLQLLAYHTACARGTDVDKPRNLAKSVTVE